MVLVVLAPDLVEVLFEELRLLNSVHLTNLGKYLADRLEGLILGENHSLVLLAGLREVFVHLILDELFILRLLFLSFEFGADLRLLFCLLRILGLLLLFSRLHLGLGGFLYLHQSLVLKLLRVLRTLDPLGVLLSRIVLIHEVFDFGKFCFFLFLLLFLFFLLLLLFFSQFGLFSFRLGLHSLRVILIIIVTESHLSLLVQIDTLLDERGHISLLYQRLNYEGSIVDEVSAKC